MVEIGSISIEELESLQKIAKETFIETYSPHNTAENLEDYLKINFNTQRLTNELTNPNSYFYLARIKNETVGYLKLNIRDAQTDLVNENALEIERIYLLKKYQGKNIGRVFLNRSLEIAKKKKVDFVWLGVWENNNHAIGFYKRVGFQAFDKHIFMFGTDEQTDIMMKLTVS